jgi:hypothetical protein
MKMVVSRKVEWYLSEAPNSFYQPHVSTELFEAASKAESLYILTFTTTAFFYEITSLLRPEHGGVCYHILI